MSPTAYYNYLKHRKNEYRDQKAKIQKRMVAIYHSNEGVPGYRQMRDYLAFENIHLSVLTAHHYMKELGLRSIVRRRKLDYKKGDANKIFPNLLNQKFVTDKPNQIWAMDFTYLQMSNGTMRYNCSIIDLYDRYVVATQEGNHITSELAILTVQKALKTQRPAKGIILHSDQGSQFTAKIFNEFCKNSYIQQSMSRAGCPYDNAPMERFYNTLKNEYFNLHKFADVKTLDNGIYTFIYCHYNRRRPHSYDNGLTPHTARKMAKEKTITKCYNFA